MQKGFFIIMIINNVGYDHCHDADFFINRPSGSGDYLLLILKTDAIFTIDSNDLIVPANSVFIYSKDVPQNYRCIPQHTFENDWIHFEFEADEEEYFLSLDIPYMTPVPMDNICFLSFCIKSIAHEACAGNIHGYENIRCYMMLIFNKISEQLNRKKETEILHNLHYEMLTTIRNKIYSKPYEFRTIDSTAHEVRMSKSSFQHLYKKQFGITFIQDLINSRISYAKMLLTTTNFNICDVAGQCGYSNYSHFERQFKKKCGVTPAEYRKKFIFM